MRRLVILDLVVAELAYEGVHPDGFPRPAVQEKAVEELRERGVDVRDFRKELREGGEWDTASKDREGSGEGARVGRNFVEKRLQPLRLQLLLEWRKAVEEVFDRVGPRPPDEELERLWMAFARETPDSTCGRRVDHDALVLQELAAGFYVQTIFKGVFLDPARKRSEEPRSPTTSEEQVGPRRSLGHTKNETIEEGIGYKVVVVEDEEEVAAGECGGTALEPGFDVAMRVFERIGERMKSLRTRERSRVFSFV